MLTRLLFVAYFIEVGLLLILVPWSSYWDHNYFAASMPALQAIMHNNYVRGAVTGIGVINLCAGLADLGSVFAWRRR